ncbi:MAG TPA: response regulator [Candidatus Wujingus californicus]|jgi:CheY-like chemotaxis protein|uniref:response regulator n=1 Tax=Candidatus Wujingus californicus TaxID=3367618 RepID=UPI001E072435|nr:response regulator [Planctomycetota bacterium]
MNELLIVEDDPEMQEFYKDMLQGEPYTVTLVSNADEGLKKIKEKKFDIVILDILMDGLTGDRLFAILRRDLRYKDVPVIMASALDEKTYRCFQALGNVSFLEKPFDKEKLLGEIAKRFESKK